MSLTGNFGYWWEKILTELEDDIEMNMSSQQMLMASRYESLREAVGVIVEKVLITTDLAIYENIVRMLDERDLTFDACYAYPAILNAILRQHYGTGHTVVVQQIKSELERFEDEKNINAFVQILSL